MRSGGGPRATVYAQQKPRSDDESDLLLSHLIDEEYTNTRSMVAARWLCSSKGRSTKSKNQRARSCFLPFSVFLLFFRPWQDHEELKFLEHFFMSLA